MKAKGINPNLTQAINKMIREVMKEERLSPGKQPKYSLTDKMKVLDRALKHEAIRLKVEDSGEGAFFQPGKEEADDEAG